MEKVISYETVGPYFENKFILSYEKELRIKTYLQHYFCKPAKYSAGENFTIYYDTKNLHDFQEGISGTAFKQKIRLRQYTDDADYGRYALEIKARMGHTVTKKRIRFHAPAIGMPPDLVRLLRTQQMRQLPEFFSNIFRPVTMYFPRISIRYKRKRFICPYANIRLNLDTQIRSEMFWMDRNVVVKQTKVIPFMILEVKGLVNSPLPYQLDVLKPERRSISKYCYFIQEYFS